MKTRQIGYNERRKTAPDKQAFMPTITIKVFHSLDGQKELVRTIRLESSSARMLNGSRALKILHQQFPELGRISTLVKLDGGWQYQRAIEQKPNCPFHFKWEQIYIAQDP